MGNCFSSEGGSHHHGGVGGVAGPSPGGIPRLPDSAPIVSLNTEAMMPMAALGGGHGRPSLDLGSSRPLPDPSSEVTPSSIKVGEAFFETSLFQIDPRRKLAVR
jgi:hypothetical protein